ncbi:MAG: hypothetical protein GY771_15825 [bacterium]|nr:hypothetical protein [bacterium]
MIRTMSITLVAVAFLPIALILILFGINRLNPSRRKGIWLKLAVIINSALVIALGIIGCKGGRINDGGNAGGEEVYVDCYAFAPADITEVPETFDKSNDWSDLEYTMVALEREITRGNYDEATEKNNREKIGNAVSNLKNDGLITEDEKILLWAYCLRRVDSYADLHVSCYAAMPSPGSKEASKSEIIEATIELRQLYADGKIQTPAYETTLATLEERLALYTGKKDNAVLRQLLLDLADGVGGMYF